MVWVGQCGKSMSSCKCGQKCCRIDTREIYGSDSVANSNAQQMQHWIHIRVHRNWAVRARDPNGYQSTSWESRIIIKLVAGSPQDSSSELNTNDSRSDFLPEFCIGRAWEQHGDVHKVESGREPREAAKLLDLEASHECEAVARHQESYYRVVAARVAREFHGVQLEFELWGADLSSSRPRHQQHRQY